MWAIAIMLAVFVLPAGCSPVSLYAPVKTAGNTATKPVRVLSPGANAGSRVRT